MFDAPADERLTGIGQFIQRFQLPAHHAGKLVVVGFDQIGSSLQPLCQQLAVCIQKDLCPCLFAGFHPCVVGVLGGTLRQAACQHHDIPLFQFLQQVVQQGGQLRGIYLDARLVDVGVGVVFRVDDLQVRAGLAGHETEVVGKPFTVQCVLNGFAAVTGQNADSLAGPTQLCDHLADVDALATGIGTHLGDPVYGVQRKVRDLNGLVQRRIQCYGVDHGNNSLLHDCCYEIRNC